MIQPIEGRGNIFSPHLVEDFGDQITEKMGSCNSYYIFILFFIYIDAFRLEGINSQHHFFLQGLI